MDVDELERSLEEGKKTSNPRVLCIINPGNPTGQVQSRQNIENVLKFAKKHNLFVMADEVSLQYNLLSKFKLILCILHFYFFIPT